MAQKTFSDRAGHHILCLLLCLPAADCAKEATNFGAETSVSISEAVPEGPIDTGDGDIDLTHPFSPTSAAGVALQFAGNGACVETKQTSSLASPSFVLAKCAATAAQRYVLDRGHFSQDGTNCLTAATGGTLGFAACSQLSVEQSWLFLPILDAFFNDKGFFVASADANGKLGSLVGSAGDPNAVLAQLQWQLSSASGKSKGSPWLFQGDPKRCLTVAGSTLRSAACSLSNANQLWSSISGILRSDSGHCLTYDVNQLVVSAVECAATPTSDSSLSNAYFVVGRKEGLRCLTLGDNNSLLVPVPDDNSHILLRVGDAGVTSYWTYGGASYLSSQ